MKLLTMYIGVPLRVLHKLHQSAERRYQEMLLKCSSDSNAADGETLADTDADFADFKKGPVEGTGGPLDADSSGDERKQWQATAMATSTASKRSTVRVLQRRKHWSLQLCLKFSLPMVMLIVRTSLTETETCRKRGCVGAVVFCWFGGVSVLYR